MWRAFQTAAFVSVGETFSVTSPLDVRWLLTRVTTSDARSGRDVPQSAPGVQLPTTALALGGDVASVTAAASMATRKTAAATTPRGERRSCIEETPWS
jgi:hypothetical protein